MRRVMVMALAALVLAPTASASLGAPALQGLERTASGGVTFHLDCTYAARGAQGVAFPEWHGQTAEVYVHPWVCGAVNAAMRHGWAGADHEGTTAMAALILTHEAIHVSAFAGAHDEHLTECRALAILPDVLLAWGAPARMVPALVAWATQAHAHLLASMPTTYGPSC